MRANAIVGETQHPGKLLDSAPDRLSRVTTWPRVLSKNFASQLVANSHSLRRTASAKHINQLFEVNKVYT